MELCSEELLNHRVVIKSSGKKFEPIFCSTFNILQSVVRARTGEKEIPVLKFYQNRIKEKELYINKLLIESLYLMPCVAQVTWHWMFNIFLLALSDFFATCMHMKLRKEQHS
jgi:hypothetical protein